MLNIYLNKKRVQGIFIGQFKKLKQWQLRKKFSFENMCLLNETFRKTWCQGKKNFVNKKRKKYLKP